MFLYTITQKLEVSRFLVADLTDIFETLMPTSTSMTSEEYAFIQTGLLACILVVLIVDLFRRIYKNIPY